MLIWCFAAFFSAESKAQLKFFLFTFALFAPRILKHYSILVQYAEFFLSLLKGRTIQVCWYTGCYTVLVIPLHFTQQQPFLLMLLIYYVNQYTLKEIYKLGKKHYMTKTITFVFSEFNLISNSCAAQKKNLKRLDLTWVSLYTKFPLTPPKISNPVLIHFPYV
jgi:hypothetical protein